MIVLNYCAIAIYSAAQGSRLVGGGGSAAPTDLPTGYATAVTNAVSNFRKDGRIVGGQRPMRIKSDYGREEVWGADSAGATENFVPLLTEESGQTSRFGPVPLGAYFDF